MSKRDYVPSRETNLKSRMMAGQSMADGVAGRCVAQKEGAFYRTYHKADGTVDHMKRWNGTLANYDFGVDCCE